jgi:hypothetical protein
MARKTKEQQTQEELWCWELKLEHPRWSQQLIADEIKRVHQVELSQPTVSRALERANKRYLRRIEKQIAAFKGQQISRLDWILAEAQEGWKRSYGTTKSMRKSSSKTTEAPTDDFKMRWHQAGKDPAELPALVSNEEESVVMDMEDIAGSTAFLAEMRACIEAQNKLMGVNAPDESIVTNRGGDYAAELPTPVTKEQWAEMMGAPLVIEAEKVNHDAKSEEG